MQVNTADRIQSHGHDSDSIGDTVDSFVDTVVSGFNALDAPDEVIDEIEETGDQLVDKVAEIESNAGEVEDDRDEIADEVEEIRSDIAETRRQQAQDRQRISEVEDELEQIDGRGADSSGNNPEGIDDETTPLERVCGLPEHEVENNLTANQRRARSVARRIDQYGRSVPAGVAITSSRIKRVLTAQEDTTIHRQTVKRVAQFLEDFGDGEVEIKETRGGKTTVVFDEEIVDRVTRVVTANDGGGVTPTVV